MAIILKEDLAELATKKIQTRRKFKVLSIFLAAFFFLKFGDFFPKNKDFLTEYSFSFVRPEFY